jgi:hypothetical protein
MIRVESHSQTKAWTSGQTRHEMPRFSGSVAAQAPPTLAASH